MLKKHKERKPMQERGGCEVSGTRNPMVCLELWNSLSCLFQLICLRAENVLTPVFSAKQ